MFSILGAIPCQIVNHCHPGRLVTDVAVLRWPVRARFIQRHDPKVRNRSRGVLPQCVRVARFSQRQDTAIPLLRF